MCRPDLFSRLLLPNPPQWLEVVTVDEEAEEKRVEGWYDVLSSRRALSVCLDITYVADCPGVWIKDTKVDVHFSEVLLSERGGEPSRPDSATVDVHDVETKDIAIAIDFDDILHILPKLSICPR